ncbi:acyltransferase family protein [Teredinibacter turnerae]|uniref:acyltransferase family protein n=1 Tax=Teredinibacter turnerae TaxID=2426 RepID=UPI00036CDE87|nr:acyltransferase [Teredinibacter turnerae]
MKYRPEIDGLRAIAVIPVVLFHAGFEIFKGGFVGVDVFFVISGYLITTTLIEDIEKRQFSIGDFYERRARRILPALFLVMLACIPFAFFWSFNQQYREFSQSLIAASFFASNILFWRKTDYFSTASDEKPLLHTWSLAVEEQYYILFPVFLISAWRLGKNRVFWIVVFMAATSILLSEVGTRKFPAANFFLAPTRAWELFAGSISAFVLQMYGVRKNDFLAGLGLTAIVTSVLIYDESTPFPSAYTLAPIFGTALIILHGDYGTLTAKLLRKKVLISIGLISYSIYLWHQPILAFTKWRNYGEELSTIKSFFSISLTLIFAAISYKFIEKPIRKKTFLKTKKSIFKFSAIGITFFATFGLIGQSQYRLGDKKQPTFIQNLVQYEEYEADNYFLIAKSWELQKKINGINFFAVDRIEKDREPLFPKDNTKENLLVVGNSHSVDFFNVLSFSNKISSHFNLARFGIQISDINNQLYNSPNYIESDVVILCSLMSEKDIDFLHQVAERVTKDKKSLFICQNIFTWMERNNYTKLDRMIINGALNKQGASDLSNEINMTYTNDYKNLNFVNEDQKNIYLKMRGTLKKMSSKIEFATIDRMSYVCHKETCEIVNSKIGKLFFDMGHHTLLGAKHFALTIDKNGLAENIINH